MATFEQAAFFTLDADMKKVLIDCGKNRWPSQFTMKNGKIQTALGNVYAVPRNPLDLCNLVHDILHGIEKSTTNVVPPLSRRNSGVTDDAIYAFAKREAVRMGKGDDHIEKLTSCIHTALYLQDITPSDIEMEGEFIRNIRGINTEVPSIQK